MSRREQYVLLAFALVGLGFLLMGAKKSPGGSVKVPAASSEDITAFVPPPGVVDPSPHHVGPYGLVYTPHRYPATCGNEISTLIHRGWGTMFLPHEKDMTWLSAPPSEAEI